MAPNPLKTHILNFAVNRDLLARVDEWRRRHPDLPNRSHALRILIEQGLKTWGRK